MEGEIVKTSKKNPVIIIHGIRGSMKTLQKLTSFLKDRGFEVYGLDYFPNDGSVGLEFSAEQVKEYIEKKFNPGEKIDIVAFSMGGLIARYYMYFLGGDERVINFVSVSSPNDGTIWAYFSKKIGIRQIRPGSDFLENLKTKDHLLNEVNTLSLRASLDTRIIPATSSELEYGKNYMIRFFGHQGVIENKKTLEKILKHLSLE
ncbi:MAG: alpha/beta fold hydrolase [Candidatus Paceibacterota bacterium]